MRTWSKLNKSHQSQQFCECRLSKHRCQPSDEHEGAQKICRCQWWTALCNQHDTSQADLNFSNAGSGSPWVGQAHGMLWVHLEGSVWLEIKHQCPRRCMYTKELQRRNRHPSLWISERPCLGSFAACPLCTLARADTEGSHCSLTRTWISQNLPISPGSWVPLGMEWLGGCAWHQGSVVTSSGRPGHSPSHVRLVDTSPWALFWFVITTVSFILFLTSIALRGRINDHVRVSVTHMYMQSDEMQFEPLGTSCTLKIQKKKGRWWVISNNRR